MQSTDVRVEGLTSPPLGNRDAKSKILRPLTLSRTLILLWGFYLSSHSLSHTRNRYSESQKSLPEFSEASIFDVLQQGKTAGSGLFWGLAGRQLHVFHLSYPKSPCQLLNGMPLRLVKLNSFHYDTDALKRVSGGCARGCWWKGTSAST